MTAASFAPETVKLVISAVRTALLVVVVVVAKVAVPVDVHETVVNMAQQDYMGSSAVVVTVIQAAHVA